MPMLNADSQKCTWSRCTSHSCKSQPVLNIQKHYLPLLTKILENFSKGIMISEHALIQILTLWVHWKYPKVGQIWSEIEKLVSCKIWDVPWHISMATICCRTFRWSSLAARPAGCLVFGPVFKYLLDWLIDWPCFGSPVWTPRISATCTLWLVIFATCCTLWLVVSATCWGMLLGLDCRGTWGSGWGS